MFRDTSMDYLTLEEIQEIKNNNQKLTDEDFLAMDESEFRARVRERSHHSLEIQMYHAAYRNEKLKASQADYVKHLLELWRKRGLGTDLPEYKYASFLIESADKLSRGEAVDSVSLQAEDGNAPDGGGFLHHRKGAPFRQRVYGSGSAG